MGDTRVLEARGEIRGGSSPSMPTNVYGSSPVGRGNCLENSWGHKPSQVRFLLLPPFYGKVSEWSKETVC